MLSSLFQLAGNLATSAVNANLQRETNHRNEELARQQNQWNLNQWSREASYNSPSSQVQRLRQAGINPALAFTNGVDNLAPASPEMVSSQGHAPSIGSPFAGFAQSSINEQLAKSQIELNESAALRNNAQAGLVTTQTDIAGVRFKILARDGLELSQLQKDKMAKDIEYLSSQISNVDADTAVKILQGESLRNYIDHIQPAELQKLQSEIGLNEAQTKQILELLPYKIALTKAETAKNYSEASLNNARATFQQKLNDSDEYVSEFIRSVRLDNEGKVIEMDIKAGANIQAARVGSSYTGHYAGDYANVSHPASGSDQAVQGAGTLFQILGKLFSLIGKF